LKGRRKKSILNNEIKYITVNKYKNKFKKMLKRRKRFSRMKTAILHFKSSYSNYFITLTDLSFNVVYSCSSGLLSYSNNKKQKTSTVVCYPMLYRILKVLKTHKVRRLYFVIKSNFDKFFYNAFFFFRENYFKIGNLYLIKNLPHHLGQRKRKAKRI